MSRTDRELNLKDPKKDFSRDLRYMNIPKSYWYSSLEEWGYGEEIILSVQNVIKEFSNHLITVITGNSLSGKTSLAVLYLMEAWRKHCSCYMVSNNVMWECRDDLFDGEATIFKRCHNVDVLAIDNILIGGVKNEYHLNALRTIIRYRSDWKKPTILVFGLNDDNQVNKLLPADIKAIVANNSANGVYILETKRDVSKIC